MITNSHSPIYHRLEQTSYTRANVGETTVAIIGCGALGSEVARLLGLLGVGRVLLIEHDLIESTNLIHSPYLRDLRGASSIGRPKSEVLAGNLTTHFPDTTWNSLVSEIADVGFGQLQHCALLFSCTDNTLARVETAYAAHRLHLPVADAGLKGRAFWSGRVTWFPASAESACYLCQLGEVRRAELLSLAISSSQSCSAPPPDDQSLPSTPTMASIVAGMQVDIGLRLALSAAQEPIALEAHAWELSLPLPETTWRSFTIPKSADCPWHGSDPTLDLVQLSCDASVGQSLAGHADGLDLPTLELDWPLCIKARCSTCNHLWSSMVRLATLRRRMLCPACGGTHLHSVETLSSIMSGTPIADLTPAELGLPQDHLFTLRRS